MSDFLSRIPGVPTGEETILRIREQSDTAMIAFSCGKDAIAAWLAIRPHFERVVPFYMYLVPDLEFVERSLAYYESYFGTRIVRVPHPSLYRMLSNLIGQPPERCATIEAADLPVFDYEAMHAAVCEDNGLPTSTWYASGVRAADSPMRRLAMATHGPINDRKRVFYPVWDLRKAGLVDLIHRSDCKLPVDYKLFGRSFDGLDHRFLKPIKEHFPDDYRRILDWFPLAELELMRPTLGASHAA